MVPAGSVHRTGAARALGAMLLLLAGAALAACGGSPADAQITAVASRARQALDDATYFPVEVGGRWVLSGPPGSWLQRAITTHSTPWYWNAARCTVLDTSLVPGMRIFMHEQLTALFTGALAASLESQFDHRVQRSTAALCPKPDPNLVTGPPGPILDQTRVETTVVRGTTATVTAQITVTDWQGGVTDRPTVAQGRVVGWAVVHNLLDAHYLLHRDTSGRWQVSSYTATFVPGHGP